MYIISAPAERLDGAMNITGDQQVPSKVCYIVRYKYFVGNSQSCRDFCMDGSWVRCGVGSG